MSGERPSAKVQADAADAVVQAIETAHSALYDARKLIRYLHEQGCLTLIDRQMALWIEKCDEPLWAARKVAVVEAYDYRRKADIETGGPHGR